MLYINIGEVEKLYNLFLDRERSCARLRRSEDEQEKEELPGPLARC